MAIGTTDKLAALRRRLLDRAEHQAASCRSPGTRAHPTRGVARGGRSERPGRAGDRSALVRCEAQRDRDELALVQAALARLYERRYGRCSECGEASAAERLQAQPAAARCTTGQTRAESRRV
jgi:RNA polymerase-binding transcription factor DksA